MLENSEVPEEWNSSETSVLLTSPSPANQSSQVDVPSETNALLTSPSPAGQKKLPDCSAALLEVASKTCDHIPEQELRFDCKFDVCESGDPDTATDSVGMEILEVKEAHGVVTPEGDGRCLDCNGHSYTEFKVNGTSTDLQCQEILRSLAQQNISGVRGAELNPDQECLIIVDPDIDPDIVHRWSTSGWSLEESAAGAGIVSNATGTQEWSCWKLI